MRDAPGLGTEALERALTRLVRSARLPAAYQRVSEAAGVRLDRPTHLVLAYIQQWQPVRARSLAERLGVNPSTVSRHVERLVEEGLTDRHTDPSDARASLIELTDQGAEVLERLQQARCRLLDRALIEWAPSERRLLAEMLERLLARLEESRAGRQS